jgi:hypothetical protein
MRLCVVGRSYLTRSLREALGSDAWAVALVHGSWDQRRLSGGVVNSTIKEKLGSDAGFLSGSHVCFEMCVSH